MRVADDTPAMPHLRLISGEAHPPLVRLEREDVVIGRAGECAVRVNDVNASRTHCRLSRADDRWILVDLDSSNGTFVNSERVRKKTLEDGDKISTGATIFVFGLADLRADAAPPDSSTKRMELVPPARSPLDSIPIDLGTLMEAMLGLAQEQLHGRRLLVAVCDDTGRPRTAWSRGFDADPLAGSTPVGALIDQARRQGEGLIVPAGGERFARLCVPIRDESGILGAAYLDGGAEYLKPHLGFFNAIARRLVGPLTTALRYRDLRARLSRSEMELTFTRLSTGAPRRLGDLIGRSACMQAVFDTVRRVAATTSSVVIEGETGTGKELVARAIHELSPRAAGPFIAENCAAISPSLAESELFGHRKGAFTGATDDRHGLFQEAGGGTLFLDEVGDMPADLQTKLLRALQERAVRPVGATAPVPVDVRVLTASNRPLESLVRSGRFREDLYYRLNVVRIELPPLRERPDDIPLLAQQFLADGASGVVKDLSPDAVRSLLRHPWPGNIRELRNAIERLIALSDGPVITGPEAERVLERPDDATSEVFDFKRSKDRMLERFEREFLLQSMARHGGNVAEVAREVSLERRHLYRLLEKHGIDPASYRR